MITFYGYLDFKVRTATSPTVARFEVLPGVFKFIVIGTTYGHIRTTSGDIRTWASYSGAQRFAKNYLIGV